jgi:hypothetical protein
MTYELTSLAALSESDFKNGSLYGFFFQEVMDITIIRAANKKLQQIQNGSPRERILISTTLISQIRIAFVVEHLIGGQIHAAMEYLQW